MSTEAKSCIGNGAISAPLTISQRGELRRKPCRRNRSDQLGANETRQDSKQARVHRKAVPAQLGQINADQHAAGAACNSQDGMSGNRNSQTECGLVMRVANPSSFRMFCRKTSRNPRTCPEPFRPRGILHIQAPIIVQPRGRKVESAKRMTPFGHFERIVQHRNFDSPLLKKDADYIFYELTRSLVRYSRK